MSMKRRGFVTVVALGAGAGLAPAGAQAGPGLGEWKSLGGIREEQGGEAPIEGARRFQADAAGDGIAFEFPAGTLVKARALTSDMLLDGEDLAVFQITLREGEQGRTFRFVFGGLNQCSFRMRMDLGMVDQGRWMADREGAFLKPMCSGDRVDLTKVDRLSLAVLRKGPRPVRWWMTGLQAVGEMPRRLGKPVLPRGVLLDEFGQSAQRQWVGKTRSADELKNRIRGQLEAAGSRQWPEAFSPWGGWKEKKLAEGTGWFRTEREGGRWWLVDPDGYAFWSAGLDCVRVDTAARIDGLETALQWIPKGPEYAD